VLQPLDDDTDLLVLDCEGFGKTRGFDVEVQLFALLTLISSKLIFNQFGTISEQSMEDLSFI
jgi:hypothetical protein